MPVLPAPSVTVTVAVIVPSVAENVDRSTSPTTQSLPTLLAETTIGAVPAAPASSIDTETPAASLETLESIRLTWPTSDAFVVASALAKATVAVGAASSIT